MRSCEKLIGGFLVAVIGFSSSAQAAMSDAEKKIALQWVHYVEYTGEQQSWPTNNAGMAEIRRVNDDVVIYQSLPNKPYEILGTIQASGRSTIKHVREAIRAVGADAVLVYGHKTFFDAGIKLQAQMVVKSTDTTKITLIEGVLIRWKR